MTIDPDLDAKLRRIAQDRGISFKEALNAALREGLGAHAGTRCYRLPARPLGLRALRLASALEDQETVRKLELRK